MLFFLKDQSQPTLIKTFDTRQKFLVQVVGPGVLQLGTDQREVMNNYGLQIQQGTGGPNNIEDLQWIGELWASCTDPNTQCIFVFPDLTPYQKKTYAEARSGFSSRCA